MEGVTEEKRYGCFEERFMGNPEDVLSVEPGMGQEGVQLVLVGVCHSREEMGRYYYRSGILLCISYLLGADLHYENLIAYGEHPILVDLEMAEGSGFGHGEDAYRIQAA